MKHAGLPRPNVADIARRAGVSTATVSRALNQPALVRASVRQRVFDIARELNYRLNPAARDLGRNRSSLVLLAVGDPAEMTLSHSVLMGALASRILQSGEFPVLIADDDEQREATGEETSAGWKPAPQFILGAAAGALGIGEGPLRRLSQYDIPTVVVDANRGERQSRYSSLCLDRRGAYHKAAAHLLERGHRRIGFVGPAGDAKFEALAEAVRAAGAHCCAVEAETLAQFVAHEKQNKRLTAWVLPGETLIVTVVAVLAAAGRRLGVDTAVVAQGDSYLAQRCSPPLTALRHPNELMANLAMDLLHAAQQNPNRTQTATLELELVVRASTEFVQKQEKR
jgi:LacI family repressor for deo operon, udp, cdd, tsx, nupC, and nupG